MKKQKAIILVDCSTLIYAAFHAMGHLSYNGQPTGVVYGFLSRLLTLAIRFKSNDFMFCWDAGSTHRSKAYPEYKHKRAEKRKEFTQEESIAYDSLVIQSLLLMNEVLPRMGFKNSFVAENYEADDLLGMWVNKLSKYRQNIVMVTTDADMYQCLDKCSIWFIKDKKLFNRKKMIHKYKGTTPEQWALAKAIGGCAGDSVEGIKGISDPKNPKSKVHKYLRGTLTKGVVLDRINSKEGQKIIKRNLPLVTVPYREDIMPRMIRRRSNKFSKKRFLKEFNKHMFVSFLKKENFRKWIKAFDLKQN